MSGSFTRAIVRPPSANFADGLTSAALGAPSFVLALEQHSRYCDALRHCDLDVETLPPDPRHPDATFVEDAAVLAARCNVLARPGAPSRAGEVLAIRDALAPCLPELLQITAPGTLDGGDVCECGQHFFIGVSQRTNREGAAQLAALLATAGYGSAVVDIRAVPGILHLKSGIAALGDGRIAAIESLAGHPALQELEVVRVPEGEEYAANCVRVNDRLLVAAGFPRTRRVLQSLGYDTMALEMSEFQKMDGGLSCLSLRF